jgi:16S rRNA A1518/A1519 N6-dimethyltransferase RsmA/KsgA/DIM1 with predicted DNA glycosylase/AP lyase activity
VAQAGALGLTPDKLRAILTELDINPGRRGETLSVAEFVAVSNRISEVIMGGGPGT